MEALAHLHFLRPAWLALLLPIVALWWLARRRAAGEPASAPIAPHLLAALRIDTGRGRQLGATDWFAASLACLAVAAAGPAWSRLAEPSLAARAPLAVVLKAGDSMLRQDMAPSRLARGKQKIRDLLAARPGAPAAVVVYAGTAHVLAPLTRDAEIIHPLLEGVSPAVMPVRGADLGAALARAREALAGAGAAGVIVVLADHFPAAATAAVRAHRAAHPQPVLALQLLPPDKRETGRTAASWRREGATTLAVTPDASDVRAIAERIGAIGAGQLSDDARLPWQDRAWLALWPAAALLLLAFRRGLPAAGTLLLAGALVLPPPATAGGLLDWWLTPDQQGRLHFARGAYERAAAAFRDPMWRGLALYRSGRYEAAARAFAAGEGPAAELNRGAALLRAGRYEAAVAAFERAQARAPDDERISRNLAIARAARRRAGAGEGDGEEHRAAGDAGEAPPAPSIRRRSPLTPEAAAQWMRLVDTRIAEYLATRFALEAGREAAP